MTLSGIWTDSLNYNSFHVVMKWPHISLNLLWNSSHLSQLNLTARIHLLIFSLKVCLLFESLSLCACVCCVCVYDQVALYVTQPMSYKVYSSIMSYILKTKYKVEESHFYNEMPQNLWDLEWRHNWSTRVLE